MGLHRHSFRWANGVGFALTMFFGLWLLFYFLAWLQKGFEDFSLPVPVPFAAVGLVSLVGMIVLLGMVLRYAAHGVDLNDSKPRYMLFGWTCSGCLFTLSQTLAMLRFGGKSFAGFPGWASAAYWYFAALGSVIFLILLWVNGEGHHYPWEESEEYDDYDEEV